MATPVYGPHPATGTFPVDTVTITWLRIANSSEHCFALRQIDETVMRLPRTVEDREYDSETTSNLKVEETVSLRHACSCLSIPLYPATHEEIVELKRANAIGCRAPCASLILGNDLVKVLSTFGRRTFSDIIRNSLEALSDSTISPTHNGTLAGRNPSDNPKKKKNTVGDDDIAITRSKAPVKRNTSSSHGSGAVTTSTRRTTAANSTNQYTTPINGNTKHKTPLQPIYYEDDSLLATKKQRPNRLPPHQIQNTLQQYQQPQQQLQQQQQQQLLPKTHTLPPLPSNPTYTSIPPPTGLSNTLTNGQSTLLSLHNIINPIQQHQPSPLNPYALASQSPATNNSLYSVPTNTVLARAASGGGGLLSQSLMHNSSSFISPNGLYVNGNGAVFDDNNHNHNNHQQNGNNLHPNPVTSQHSGQSNQLLSTHLTNHHLSNGNNNNNNHLHHHTNIAAAPTIGNLGLRINVDDLTSSTLPNGQSIPITSASSLDFTKRPRSGLPPINTQSQLITNTSSSLLPHQQQQQQQGIGGITLLSTPNNKNMAFHTNATVLSHPHHSHTINPSVINQAMIASIPLPSLLSPQPQPGTSNTINPHLSKLPGTATLLASTPAKLQRQPSTHLQTPPSATMPHLQHSFSYNQLHQDPNNSSHNNNNNGSNNNNNNNTSTSTLSLGVHPIAGYPTLQRQATGPMGNVPLNNNSNNNNTNNNNNHNNNNSHNPLRNTLLQHTNSFHQQLLDTHTPNTTSTIGGLHPTQRPNSAFPLGVVLSGIAGMPNHNTLLVGTTSKPHSSSTSSTVASLHQQDLNSNNNNNTLSSMNLSLARAPSSNVGPKLLINNPTTGGNTSTQSFTSHYLAAAANINNRTSPTFTAQQQQHPSIYHQPNNHNNNNNNHNTVSLLNPNLIATQPPHFAQRSVLQSRPTSSSIYPTHNHNNNNTITNTITNHSPNPNGGYGQHAQTLSNGSALKLPGNPVSQDQSPNTDSKPTPQSVLPSHQPIALLTSPSALPTNPRSLINRNL